jgi:hypothetical protein
MKNYDFIPHTANMRSSSQVLNLIESEGAAGYGFYWGLLEYLRAQPHYTGDIRAIKNIARQMKVRMDKAMRILNDYGLFILEDTRFHSPYLDEKLQNMKPKRDKSCPQNEETMFEASCKSLKINNAPFKNKKKNKNIEKDTSSPISSSSAEVGEEVKAVAEAAPVSSIPTWERYVDELQQDEQWKELMAMRTGLKQRFFSCYPRIVEHFKQHVRLLGNESQILSSADAKRYFCFFLDPGSVTFKRLWEELQKPIDRGKYKHEDYDPATGQRSYCGIPIPADAPPRPNAQAVWNEGNWVY